MDNKHGFNISIRDRVYLMWEESMRMVQNYQAYSAETDDEYIKSVFERFAETEGKHASELHQILLDKQN